MIIKLELYFIHQKNLQETKKSWLSHAIQTVGKITLDDGASFAIKKKGASLLAVGVKNVEGNFTVNQAVKIVNANDKEVAKGLVSISSDKLRSILNNKENNNSSIIVVHRDVLALSQKNLKLTNAFK